MGTPMVGRLAEAGHEVRALARTAEKDAALQQLGAEAVGTIEAAADGADVVIVCVFSDEQVQQVCMNSDLFPAMKPGAVLVIHTTGSPGTAEAIAARADRHFIDVVDAPVSGGPHDVAAGRVTLFVGGDDDAVEQVAPVLSSYGNPVLHVGPLGAGQRVKLINNAVRCSDRPRRRNGPARQPAGHRRTHTAAGTSTRQWQQPRPLQYRRSRLGRDVHHGRRGLHRQGRRGDPQDRRRVGHRHGCTGRRGQLRTSVMTSTRRRMQ